MEPSRHALPRRKPTRIPDFDYATPAWYFVTICTHERRWLFGTVRDEMMVLSDAGRFVAECLDGLSSHFEQVTVLTAVVMPNHVHAIITIDPRPDGSAGISLIEVVRPFKSITAKQINSLRHTPGLPVWQRSFHDHIIRSERAFERIWDYVQLNPEQWPHDTYFTSNDGPIASANERGRDGVGDGPASRP